jgi:hypothetical protein
MPQMPLYAPIPAELMARRDLLATWLRAQAEHAAQEPRWPTQSTTPTSPARP